MFFNTKTLSVIKLKTPQHLMFERHDEFIKLVSVLIHQKKSTMCATSLSKKQPYFPGMRPNPRTPRHS